MLDELAQEQGIPTAGLPQEVQRRTVDRTVEHIHDDALDLGTREGLQRDEGSGAVLPQRRNRIRRGFAAPHGHDGTRGSACDEELHERSRCIVEQVCVVDPEQQSRAVVAPERTDDAAQGRLAVTADRRIRYEVGDRAEWNGRRRLCGRDPFRPVAVRRRTGEHLAGEPGLADTGGARQHHAPACGQRRCRQIQLVVASDERPLAQVDLVCAANLGCVRDPPCVHRTSCGKERKSPWMTEPGAFVSFPGQCRRARE